MTDIAKLAVRFEAETAKFRKQLEQNNRELEKFRRTTQKQLGFVRQAFAVGLGTGLADGVKAALRSVPQFISQSLDSADQLQKLEQRIGASTESLSQYRHVAKLTGVEFGTLTTGWQRMTRRVAEAAQGTGEARNALKELGVDVQALNQLAPDQQFEVLADAIQSVKNPADQVRLAMKLFDTEGVALLQTMQGGSEAIRAMREEADALGLTLSQDAADAAAKANDAMAKLGSASQAAGITLINTLGPAIEAVANWLQEDLPGAVQIAVDAFWELQKFIQQTGGFVTGALAGIEFALADAADAVGADQLSRAFRKAGEDYAAMADNFERAAIRIQRTKLDAPDISSPNIGGVNTQEFIAASPGEAAGGGAARTAKLTEAQKAYNQVVEEGRRITESLRTPLEQYQAQIANLNRLRDAGTVSQETYNRAVASYQDQLDQASGVAERYGRLQQVIAEVDPVAPLLDQLSALEDLREAYPEYEAVVVEKMFRVQEEIDKVTDTLEGQKDAADQAKSAWEDLGGTFTSAFEDAIVQGSAFSDVVKGLEQDLLRIATRKLFTEPLTNAVSSAFSGGGAGGIGDLIGGLFGGFRAAGGPVTAGRAYMVGEQGPEMFIPRESGRVASNQETRSMGGGVTININGVKDYDSFRRSETQLRAAARRALA